MKRHKLHERPKQKQKQQEGFFSEFNWHSFFPSSPLWTGKKSSPLLSMHESRTGYTMRYGQHSLRHCPWNAQIVHCYQIFSTNYPRRGEFATVLQRTYKLLRKWILITCKKAASRSNPGMNGRFWGAYFARLWTRGRTHDRGIDHVSSSRICVWI